MFSLAALVLWMIAIPFFLGGSIWIGLGAGVLAFLATLQAMKRPDDIQFLFGIMLMLAGIGFIIRLLSFVFP